MPRQFLQYSTKVFASLILDQLKIIFIIAINSQYFMYYMKPNLDYHCTVEVGGSAFFTVRY